MKQASLPSPARAKAVSQVATVGGGGSGAARQGEVEVRQSLRQSTRVSTGSMVSPT